MKKIMFKNLPISEEILNATIDMGFENATEIQAQAIPLLMNGSDVVAQSQTGTGKTASFGIPLIDKVEDIPGVQGLVVCPTRELALQVVGELKSISKYKKNIKVVAVYGGAPVSKQINNIKKGANIVVGTPGRMIDLINRGSLKLGGLKMICLDEADEMLNMGFVDDIEKILEGTPSTRQTILFSATMPERIRRIAKKYQTKPQYVKIKRKNLTVDRINEYAINLKRGQKTEVLARLIEIENPKQSLIFCNTKRMVDNLVLELQKEGHKVDYLHGDLKQSQRDNVMNKFRNGTIRHLIATDVAARGIDVDDIEIVFNYDLPQNQEYYVHRIGRTGRAGRKGKSITFFYNREVRDLRNIERYTKSKMKDMKTPSFKDLKKAKSNRLFHELKSLIDDNNKNKNNENKELYNQLLEDYSHEEITLALLNKVLNIKKAVKKEKVSKANRFANTGAEPGMVRLFLNVGKMNRVKVGDILGAVAGEAKISGKLVGTIDIFKAFSFVEVPMDNALDVINSLKGIKMKGVKLNVEPANAK
ncbi:MAG: DEAD/DEAH box helicase [Bacillota bacterium]|nr:DEAD/DEAH box helicase [Bacillota bacterium]